MSLLLANNRRKLQFRVKTIYQISRPSETAAFAFEVSPRRLLFHGSSMSNWLGICSRGLLLPRHVEASGVRRTDAGMLGAGLYFASDASTAAQYCHPGKSGKRRLMLVTEVAVGRCKDLTRVDPSLRAPPVGYDSTRGVPSGGAVRTDFADEEFAVYSLNRQRMRYLVDFTLESDSTISFGEDSAPASDILQASGDLPSVGEDDAAAPAALSAAPLSPFVGAAPGRVFAPMRELNPPNAAAAKDVPPSRLAAVQPPQEAGLVSKSGEPIALRSIAVRSRVVDCVADVCTLFFSY